MCRPLPSVPILLPAHRKATVLSTPPSSLTSVRRHQSAAASWTGGSLKERNAVHSAGCRRDALDPRHTEECGKRGWVADNSQMRHERCVEQESADQSADEPSPRRCVAAAKGWGSTGVFHPAFGSLARGLAKFLKRSRRAPFAGPGPSPSGFRPRTCRRPQGRNGARDALRLQGGSRDPVIMYPPCRPRAPPWATSCPAS